MRRSSLRILVTAGPTREYWDPVRFISNESTGVMGVACARECRRRGHRVKLILGPPHHLLSPLWGERIKPALSGLVLSEVEGVEGERGEGIQVIPVVTAREMLAVLQKEWSRADALIMTAAVSDFRPRGKRAAKIPKRTKRALTLDLVPNPDILRILSRKKENRCLAGFALETKRGLKNGTRKLRQKGLDLVVCNWVGKGRAPFGDRDVTVALLDKKGTKKWLRGVRKAEVAKTLVDKVERICYERKKEGGQR